MVQSAACDDSKRAADKQLKEKEMRQTRLSLALVSFFALSTVARAHFLFIRIGEPAEAGRTVEVYFSEKAEAGDPRFIHKVAGAELTLQTAPGKFQPLAVREGADRLRADSAGCWSRERDWFP